MLHIQERSEIKLQRSHDPSAGQLWPDATSTALKGAGGQLTNDHGMRQGSEIEIRAAFHKSSYIRAKTVEERTRFVYIARALTRVTHTSGKRGTCGESY